MKNNFKIFLGESFFCGAFTFLGSILGNAFNQNALFAGAIMGGCSGVILSTYILARRGVINNNSLIPVIAWGIVSFGTATLFSVTNLNSPIIPLLSVLLVGLGCIMGNSFKLTKGNYIQFYISLISFLLIIPALYFVIGSIVKYNVGFSQSFTLLDWMNRPSSGAQVFNKLSPLVFLGGPILAIILNLFFTLKKRVRDIFLLRSYRSLSVANLTVTITSISLLFTITLYLFLENI